MVKGKLTWFEKHLEPSHTAPSMSHTDKHNSGSAAYYIENIDGFKDEKILHWSLTGLWFSWCREELSLEWGTVWDQGQWQGVMPHYVHSFAVWAVR